MTATPLTFLPPLALPSAGSALLAMLGQLPDDDALVLGQSGPQFSAEQCAALTAWRVQQAYTQLLAVAPVWAALRQQPASLPAVTAAFAAHPWSTLLSRMLADWCAASTSVAPDLATALALWQRLHEAHWQTLAVPPWSPPTPVNLSSANLPLAELPSDWQHELAHYAGRAGQLAGQLLQQPVGSACGARTPFWQQDGATLYRYPAAPDSKPLLLVYAWLNRADMLDLAPEQSLIAALQAQGFAIWLLDWADAGAHACTLEQYLFQHLDGALARVCAASGCAQTALLGICQGGTLALTYAALRPQRIASLSLAVTPIDFQVAADRLSTWARALPTSAFAALGGHGPGPFNLAFLQLQPFRLRLGKYLGLLRQPASAAARTAFLRMEHWLMAGPLLSGPALAAYLERYYQQNLLCRNALVIAGETVRLDRVALPVQLLIAEHDHIVPPASSLALTPLLPTETDVAAFDTGHIGLFVGRARTAVAARIAAFVRRC